MRRNQPTNNIGDEQMFRIYLYIFYTLNSVMKWRIENGKTTAGYSVLPMAALCPLKSIGQVSYDFITFINFAFEIYLTVKHLYSYYILHWTWVWGCLYASYTRNPRSRNYMLSRMRVAFLTELNEIRSNRIKKLPTPKNM